MARDPDAPYLAGLFALTVAPGVVDAVSYLALDHVFTGNMTGNVLFVGFGLAGSGEVPLLNNAVALVGFLAGAVLAGRVVHGHTHATRLPTAPLLLVAGTAAAVLLLAIAWLLLGTPSGGRLIGLTALLVVAMGMQAVAARGARIPDVTTVVITSTLVSFAVDSPLAGGTGEKSVPPRGRGRLDGLGAPRSARCLSTSGPGPGRCSRPARAWLSGAVGLGLARYREGRRAGQHRGKPRTAQ